MPKILWAIVLLTIVSCKSVTNTETFHFVFLNWNKADTATTMQINVVTSKEASDWQLHLRENGRGHFVGHKLIANEHKQLKKAYTIHHGLENLKPGKEYEFFITKDGVEGKTYSFKTIPKDKESVKFIVGGDTGAGKKFKKMSEIASTYEFDLAVFGGDIAYANGEPKNYKKWIKWLNSWTKASTKGSHLIPFIVAIGNHETNYYNFLGSKNDKAPFYFRLFAQGPKAHFVREIAGQKFVILDTGHITSYNKQKPFLEENLVKDDKQFQFTFYHIPFFPGHRSFGGAASKGRNAWMSIMEEKGVDVSFEHHDHVLKRTFPLKELRVDNEDGIIYLGDGAMGKSTRELNDEWYMEHAESINHFWYVDMKKDRANFKAIGMENQILDEFEKMKK